MKTLVSYQRLVGAFVVVTCSTVLVTAGTVQPLAPIAPVAGSPATGGGDSVNPVISPDGRYVLFASTANNLVANGANGPFAPHFPPKLNVFLRDRANGTTTLVSVDYQGTGGGCGDSVPRGISTNGQFALFESTATNLVLNDTNNANDVFVRDLLHGTTLLVSVGTNGGCGAGISRDSVMTPDGRYVAFSSLATNLVTGDTNAIADIFVRDLQAGITTLASPGALGAGSCDTPEITPDGHYLAFISSATNLVNGGPTLPWIYVRDLVGLTTVPAGTNLGSAETPYNHRMSDDGQFVVFESNPATSSTTGSIFRYNIQTSVFDTVATNALAFHEGLTDSRSLEITPDGRFVTYLGLTNGNKEVFVWDGTSGGTTLVSVNTGGAPSAGAILDWPAIDAGGRYVSFLSSAADLVPNSLTGSLHLYVRDLSVGATVLVDVDTNGAGSPGDFLGVPRMTSNGLSLAFDSTCGSLTAGDGNQSYDVFVRDWSAGTTELISRRLPALPALTVNGASAGPVYSVSSNGQYIAYVSIPGGLLAGTNAGYRNVFVCDVVNGTNILVSVDTNGQANADGWSTDPVISGDGRYVAFTSYADNLVPGDTNGMPDIFLRDLQAGTTTLVSVPTVGLPAGNYNSFTPTISRDGRYVLFYTQGTNPPVTEYLVRGDMQAATNQLVYYHQGSTSLVAAMTPDGRYVAYASGAFPSGSNFMVWDSELETTNTDGAGIPALVLAVNSNATHILCASGLSTAALFLPANTNVVLGQAPNNTARQSLQISADGRYGVYFASPNYPNPPSYTNQVFLYDFTANSSTLVSTAYGSTIGGNGNCDSVAISPDGHFVAYRSFASNIVPGSFNGASQVYLFDRVTGITTLASVNWFGSAPGNAESGRPVFSGDSQTLVFQSWASDLVEQDFSAGGALVALNLSSVYSGASPPALNLAFTGNFGAPSSSGQNQGPAITWPAVIGKTYQVLYKNDLNAAAWQVLNLPVTIEGNQACFHDTVGVQRFYRIVSN